MRNQRKQGAWVRLGDNAIKRQPNLMLSANDMEILIEIYRQNFALLELGTDSISYDDEIVDLISKEFAAEAGRVVPGGDLVAALTALRKRGLLPKVEKIQDEATGFGFSDIDKVG